MRIGLNALLFDSGNMGGVEVYFRNLIASLAQLDQENEYFVLVNEKGFLDLELSFPNFRKILIKSPSKHLSLLSKRVIRKAKHLFIGRQYQTTFVEDLLGEEIDRLGIDLIHHPFGLIYPLLSSFSQNVLTFWDMQHEFFPEFFSDYEIFWRESHYRPSVQLADYIIVASNFTKDNLVVKYDVSPEKIELIYFGVGPEFQTVVTPEQIVMLRAKYNLSEKFILYPAATYPHKNHSNLVRAFKLLCGKIKDVQLVLTGSEMTGETNLWTAIKELGLDNHVKRLGYVPAQDIPALYATASMMVFPSLFEGYGIPIVEAMYMGCPIVCSNVCSLPELVDDAALLVDPRDIEAIYSSMFRLLTDNALSNELVVRGYRRAACFSWSKAARRTTEVYEKTICQKNKTTFAPDLTHRYY